MPIQSHALRHTSLWANHHHHLYGEACERDGAGAALHGCCASCRRDESGLRTSVTERALHFTAAVQAVGASERDGAGAAGVAGRVHGFGATGGDTDLYGRLRSTSPKAVAYSWSTHQLLGHPRGLVGVSEVCRLGALILCRNQPVVFFYCDTGLYARELRRAGLALVETKLCSSRCSRHSVQGHDRRPLRLGIVSSFVMKPIGEPAARGLGALYCLTATSCSTV